jgi:hypothetical protein
MLKIRYIFTEQFTRPKLFKTAQILKQTSNLDELKEE